MFEEELVVFKLEICGWTSIVAILLRDKTGYQKAKEQKSKDWGELSKTQT